MSIEAAYRLLFQGTLIVLAAMAIAALIRTVTGRLTVDKIIGINLISTIVVIAIMILTVLLGEDSFVTVMLLCKIYINLFAAGSDQPKKKGRTRHDD